jgi:hypothetical protein
MKTVSEVVREVFAESPNIPIAEFLAAVKKRLPTGNPETAKVVRYRLIAETNRKQDKKAKVLMSRDRSDAPAAAARQQQRAAPLDVSLGIPDEGLRIKLTRGAGTRGSVVIDSDGGVRFLSPNKKIKCAPRAVALDRIAKLLSSGVFD